MLKVRLVRGAWTQSGNAKGRTLKLLLPGCPLPCPEGLVIELAQKPQMSLDELTSCDIKSG